MTEQVSRGYTNEISEVIQGLRDRVQVNLQSGWQVTGEDLPIGEIMPARVALWQGAELDEKGYIAWEKGRKVRWLAQVVKIPDDLGGFRVGGMIARVALVWWSEQAQVYVNGKLCAEGDLFDFAPRVLLSESAIADSEYLIAIRLVSPGHDIGALMRSLLIFESSNPLSPEPSFIADELAVLHKYLQTFAPEKLADVAEILKGLDFDPASGYFTHVLRELRNLLLPYKIDQISTKIYLVGHAHLDMAWLWPVSETWRAAENTFHSVLNLQKDFPDLIFSHSTPALYAWIEANRPELFAQIQTQVQAGKWEVTGGFWVEPELNLISGEAIARQLLYGQRYTQAKFGKIASVVWVPDTFGFCWSLPQLMLQGGIEFFATQKLRWNDTTKFPHGLFKWRSPDGSEIMSYMSALIGEGIEPVKLAEYSCEWQQQTGIADALWLPGVGDHGGGPTRDMLEIGQRWQNSPLFPDLEFISVERYLRKITEENPNKNYPVWNDEIYLEFHRGCYTTHADQKLFNRRCETLLFSAELFATISYILQEKNILPERKSEEFTQLETLWKKLLFNQFHDILPGSSIPEVYTDADPEWEEIHHIGNQILNQSLQQIIDQISLPEPPQPDGIPIFVFNSLNWTRSQVIQIDIPLELSTNNQSISIYEGNGKPLEIQVKSSNSYYFLAEDIPGIGYKIFWLVPNSESTNQPQITPPPEYILENPFLRATVDPETGNLTSIFDKTHNKEILAAPGNQLQPFQDSGQYWDAWNIDPNYQDHPLTAPQLKSITWQEFGSLYQAIRVIRQIGQSEFCQDYILTVNSPILTIHTTVDWQERHVLVKAAFPLTVTNNFATYEIPCGAIQRTTTPQTPAEKAKWEVSALRWADISESNSLTKNNYGVSLLNDCKYGYDATPNQLRLTLLRAPEWPNPNADKGFHEFTYAIYPHPQSWEQAHTVQKGYELNTPLYVAIGNNFGEQIPTNLIQNQQISTNQKISDRHSFINLSSDNIILMAFKPSEDQANQFILRYYECHGQTNQIHITNNLGLNINQAVDILERPMSIDGDRYHPSEIFNQSEILVQPWKIHSWQFDQ